MNYNLTNKVTRMIIDDKLANTFSKKYIAVISDEQYDKVQDVLLGLKKTIYLSDKEVAELDEKLNCHNDFNNLLSRTADRNNEGIAYEKKGEIEDAIKVYEENIIDGYPATHSFNRLLILYRKRKQYSEEMRVAKRAIEIFKDGHFSSKCKLRLMKAEDKI